MGCGSSCVKGNGTAEGQERLRTVDATAIRREVKGSEYLVNCICAMLIRAGNLEPRDATGSCDPYASVRIGSQEYFTRVIPSEPDPVFNERFSFLAPVSQLTTCIVTFFDKERPVGENLGTARYNLAEKDFSIESAPHWMALEDARSGQAKLRVFASTYSCFTLKLSVASTPSASADTSSQHGSGEQAVFALCAPNGLPMAKAAVRVVSESAPHVTVGTIHIPVNKLFSNRTKQNKAYTFEYTVVVSSSVSTPAPMQQEDAQELIKSVIAVATNSTSTAVATGSSAISATPVVDAGYIRLPQDAITQAASSGKISLVLNFQPAATVVSQFSQATEGMWSTTLSSSGMTLRGGALSSAVSATAGASTHAIPHNEATPTTAAVSQPSNAGAGTLSVAPDAITARSRSVGSHVGGMSLASGLNASTPRSLSSVRVGQAGFSMGLAMLKDSHSIAGRAAVVLLTMSSTMDHLLERGPLPGSPFLGPRRQQSVNSPFLRMHSHEPPTRMLSQVPEVAQSRAYSEAHSGPSVHSMVPNGSAPLPSPVAGAQEPIGNVVFPHWKASTGTPNAGIQSMLVGGAVCADCGSIGPTWVLALGEGPRFVCDPCGVIHALLNTGKLLDCALDSPEFTEVLLEGLRKGGVKQDSPTEPCATADAPFSAREQYIRRKYNSHAPALNNLPLLSSTGGASHPVGMLYVVVVKAANLECKEPSPHCDAYCVASVGQITRKTRTIENATSPAWNESLMGFKWNGSDPLLLRVFDRDNAAPEACGVACISLDGIPAAVDQTVSAPLHGVVSGQVTVEITFQKY